MMESSMPFFLVTLASTVGVIWALVGSRWRTHREIEVTSRPESAGVTQRGEVGGIGHRILRKRGTAKKSPTLRDRLVLAGLYQERLAGRIINIRGILMIVPLVAGGLAGFSGIVPLQLGLLFGLSTAMAGTLGPSFWLDHRKSQRQSRLRRALPDALDIIIVCLEGGLSLPAALAKVGHELELAHPLLAAELRIVDREVHMGRRTSEALREFAARFDLEELRSLASVVSHSERFGASVVKSLVVFADSMRIRRQQNAEERGHKAVVKLIFPTLLCIFPAMFVVLLGPAAIRIYHALAGPTGPIGS